MDKDSPSRVTPSRTAGLRVLTFLNNFNPGGVERVALRLNVAWQAQDIEAITIIGRDVGRARGAVKGLAYTTLLDGSRWYHRWPLGGIVADLPEIIRREQPDVLFCAGNTYSFAMVLMRLRLGRACPPIVAKISNDLRRADQGLLLRAAYHLWLKVQGRCIAHFVGMAAPMVEEICKFCGVSADRVTIINDPILQADQIDRLAKTSCQQGPARHGRHFLAIGRLTRQKNFPLLLAAFSRIATADDVLTIVGDGVDRAALEARIAHLGIADRVRLPGYTADVGSWFAVADALVMSSDYEGVPAVIIEAIAAGLPIIATDCSVSMAELTGRGAFGTLVPVGDVVALAAAMAALAPTRPDAASARAHVACFTVEQGAADYAALMRKVAANRAR